jgi:hypothetical protein
VRDSVSHPERVARRQALLELAMRCVRRPGPLDFCQRCSADSTGLLTGRAMDEVAQNFRRRGFVTSSL